MVGSEYSAVLTPAYTADGLGWAWQAARSIKEFDGFSAQYTNFDGLSAAVLLCDSQLAEGLELRAGFSLVGLGDAREPHSKYLQHVLSNAWQSVAVGFRRAHEDDDSLQPLFCFALRSGACAAPVARLFRLR